MFIFLNIYLILYLSKKNHVTIFLSFCRWSTTSPQGHTNDTSVHPPVPQTTHYDRERSEGGRTSVDLELSHNNA